MTKGFVRKPGGGLRIKTFKEKMRDFRKSQGAYSRRINKNVGCITLLVPIVSGALLLSAWLFV